MQAQTEEQNQILELISTQEEVNIRLSIQLLKSAWVDLYERLEWIFKHSNSREQDGPDVPSFKEWDEKVDEVLILLLPKEKWGFRYNIFVRLFKQHFTTN